MSVCADGAYSAMIRIQKTSWIYEKRKQKYWGGYCLPRREKNRQQRNL